MDFNFELLKAISETPGAPGYEDRVRALVREQVTPLVDSVEVDNMGNLIAFKKGRQDKKVMLAAHMDEISFMITHIDEDGFARIHTLGGFDPKTLTAQRVIVHGKEDVIGVMGSKPIHIMDAEERRKAPKIQDYFIDFGMSADKVNALVSVGDVVTRERTLIEMGDCVNGKSIDNRVAVFIQIEALKQLQDPAFDVYAVFTTQEEVGLRGAGVAAHTINPDFSIAIDTTIAYDLPGSSEHEQVTRLGKGTAIKFYDTSVIPDRRMIAFMKATADKHGIPWQPEVLTGGGTDTAATQRSGKNGSVAGCISIPTRHIHSVIETASKSDINHSVQLLVKCLEEMDGHDFSRA